MLPEERFCTTKTLTGQAANHLFDHLVGGHLHDQRHRQAERLGGLEIDD